MEFITEEIAKEQGLTPEQLTALKPHYEMHIAGLKQGWDNKANENAEGILTGAAAKIAEVTGIQRNQGEKLADYYIRSGNEFLVNQKTELDTLKADYAQKLKEFDGGKGQKEELEKLKGQLDVAQQQLVEFEDYKAKAGKLEQVETEYNTLREKQFFQNEKPKFPDTVNEYEAEAKWGKFLKSFNEKWNISFGENGESIAVNKENTHLTKPLSELIKADTELSALLTERQQKGTGAKPTTSKIGIENIELSDKPDSNEISAAINKHLDDLGVPKTSKERTSKFMELNKQITEKLAGKK